VVSCVQNVWWRRQKHGQRTVEKHAGNPPSNTSPAVQPTEQKEVHAVMIRSEEAGGMLGKNQKVWEEAEERQAAPGCQSATV